MEGIKKFNRSGNLITLTPLIIARNPRKVKVLDFGKILPKRIAVRNNQEPNAYAE
jgi:hypothetical protein